MSNPRAARGPVEGFLRPSLGFRCSEKILQTDNLSLLIILTLTFFIAGGPSATLSWLLPLQLGFDRFQYISLN